MTFLFIFLGLFLGLVLVGNNLILFAVISLLIIIFTYRRFTHKITFALILSLALGIGISFISIRINASSGVYTGLVIESRENYLIVLSKFEKLYVYSKGHDYEVGDILKISGNISSLVDSSLESEFSFVNFLKNQGVINQINVSNVEVNFRNFIRLNAYRHYFLNLFDEPARTYVNMFLFNVKSYKEEPTALMNSLNLMNLFSVSGLYISLIFTMVEYLLFLKFNEKHTKLLSLILLSWYLVFAFNKIGVRRIFYVKIFSYFNRYHFKTRFTYLEILALVGIMMLSVNPYLARQNGFYLGYFFSLALYFSRTVLRRNRKFKLISKTSVFSVLFMLPVSLLDTNEFHVLGALIQLILLPYCFFFMLLSFISFYSYPIKPFFNFFANTLTNLMKGLKIIDITIPFKEFTALYFCVYYSLFFLIIYFLEAHSYKKVMKCIIAGSILFIIKIVPYEMLYADSITFLNVGQGDSALIRHKNINILIDTGGLVYKDIATNVTIPHLHKKGINHLDYVFISHRDFDHSGALDSLRENYSVKTIIDTSDPFLITINDLAIKNINEWANLYEDENDKSQVLNFTCAKKNILMMGDASKNIENKIMNKYTSDDFNIDILKLGHHGSNTSSSYEFLNFIKPKEAIISVGKNNNYHHPSKETLESLDKLKIPYLRTDENSSIHYYANAFLTA